MTILVEPGSRTTTTTPDSTYSVTGLSAGVYTVTPGKEGSGFTPASQTATANENEFVPGVGFVGD